MCCLFLSLSLKTSHTTTDLPLLSPPFPTPKLLITSTHEEVLKPDVLARVSSELVKLQQALLPEKSTVLKIVGSKLSLEGPPGVDLRASAMPFIMDFIFEAALNKELDNVNEDMLDFWRKTKQHTKFPNVKITTSQNKIIFKGSTVEELDVAFSFAFSLRKEFLRLEREFSASRDILISFATNTLREKTPDVLCSIKSTNQQGPGIVPKSSALLLGRFSEVKKAEALLLAANEASIEVLSERVAVHFPSSFMAEMYKLGVAIINNKVMYGVCGG